MEKTKGESEAKKNHPDKKNDLDDLEDFILKRQVQNMALKKIVDMNMPTETAKGKDSKSKR